MGTMHKRPILGQAPNGGWLHISLLWVLQIYHYTVPQERGLTKDELIKLLLHVVLNPLFLSSESPNQRRVPQLRVSPSIRGRVPQLGVSHQPYSRCLP